MPEPETPRIAGTAHLIFAWDVGFQVDLEAAAARLGDAAPYRALRGRRPAPSWFDYEPHPVRALESADGLAIEPGPLEPIVEILLYDFGALVVTYRMPIDLTLDELPDLSARLDENSLLKQDSRRRAERALATVRDAVERPRLREVAEDYVIFAISEWGGRPPADLLAVHADTLARAIEAERGALAAEHVGRTLEGRISYAPNDMALVAWNAAILFDPEPDDVVALLQHANVELLELRILDGELDDILETADETLAHLTRRRWSWPGFREDAMTHRFAIVQTDAAVMFEGVNNAIKLMGNQYLARLYRLAAGRLDLPSWQDNVRRKLLAADSVYHKLSETAATKRLEILEVVIIALIALSIVLMFVPGTAH